ncbi:hypothetical protein J6590_054418 [Homalodisca vitripennis]|nr:hypothetical protein J6590_054418 [Homalodisca vitripennis]
MRALQLMSAGSETRAVLSYYGPPVFRRGDLEGPSPFKIVRIKRSEYGPVCSNTFTGRCIATPKAAHWGQLIVSQLPVLSTRVSDPPCIRDEYLCARAYFYVTRTRDEITYYFYLKTRKCFVL